MSKKELWEKTFVGLIDNINCVCLNNSYHVSIPDRVDGLTLYNELNTRQDFSTFVASFTDTEANPESVVPILNI